LPGICFDHEFRLRAYLNGWQVGWFPTHLERHVGGVGTFRFGNGVLTSKQGQRTWIA
jgi:hypothetical protein